MAGSLVGPGGEEDRLTERTTSPLRLAASWPSCANCCALKEFNSQELCTPCLQDFNSQNLRRSVRATASS
eukprot:5437793-Karenia_brevis.AAC.1